MTSADTQRDLENLADAAHQALRAGDAGRARALFAKAARAEEAAFEAVPDGKPWTSGILAVSAAALWFKAGDYEAAELLAHRALAGSSLPPFAKRELRELLQVIWSAQQAPISPAPSTEDRLARSLHYSMRAQQLAAPLEDVSHLLALAIRETRVALRQDEPDSASTPETAPARPVGDAASNARKVSIETLQARLADGIDLALGVKLAHWNLKGPQLIGIHEMLDAFRDELDDYNDKVAGRITELGGTAQAIADEAKLAPYPLDTYAIADHLAALIDRYAVYGDAVRKSIDDIDDAGDPGTADLFSEISRGVDKQLGVLEVHAQDPTFEARHDEGRPGRSSEPLG